MHSLPFFVIITAFFSALTNASPLDQDLNLRRASTCNAKNIAIVKADATHPKNFCNFYLGAPRVRSPFPELGVTDLLIACHCIVSSTSTTFKTKVAIGDERPTAPATCKPLDVQTIKSEFKYPRLFCAFYNAFPRTTTPIPSILAPNLLSACKCLLDTAITTTTSTKTSASISTTKTTTTTKATSISTTKTTTSSPKGSSTTLSACASPNPILEVFSMGSATASAYCSAFLSIPVKTFSVTATATVTVSSVITQVSGYQTVQGSTVSVKNIITVTATSIAATVTTDDTIATSLAKRDEQFTGAEDIVLKLRKRTSTVQASPTGIAAIPNSVISSACSCLSISPSSTTHTQTNVATITALSTTQRPFNTTTAFGTVYNSSTATFTELETTTLRKSDILTSIFDIVQSGSYQSFCSEELGYTTRYAYSYPTLTVTTSTTSFTYYYTTYDMKMRRGNVEMPTITPAALATYPADYISSGCSMAVTSPPTTTIVRTIETDTVVSTIVMTQTVIFA